jgi:para-aminobenzoate synthetase component 1
VTEKAAARRALRTVGWRDPIAAAAPFADRPWTLLMLSDGGALARWSYLALDPDRTEILTPEDPRDGSALLREALGSTTEPGAGPPFQGGVVGLAAYEYGARLEPLDLPRDPDWPDLILARYPALLAFDHHERAVHGIGRGADDLAAEAELARALSWLDEDAAASAPAGPLAAAFEEEGSGEEYEAAVADVVARIAAGELFQANVARAWRGRLSPGRTPFDLIARLAEASPAPFAAFWNPPGLALVSNSPERFVALDAHGRAETRPIKGTRPRGADAASDASLAAELSASEKDRAENLMIVDLMRNDLARVCEPGSVRVDELFRLESYANVHHLVSTVSGRLSDGADAAELLAATFPPGSITGAPKVQAMRVIAGWERPRGPWCGSLFRAGFDGALDSSVLIRTAAFVQDADGWRFRTLAGAGIVADSDPHAERLETEAKLSRLKLALTENA